jgi:hypothetical protein
MSNELDGLFDEESSGRTQPRPKPPNKITTKSSRAPFACSSSSVQSELLREPQRDLRAALPKSENTWPSRNVGDRVLVLPVVWRQMEFGSRARAGRGSCWDGPWILLLDLILLLTTLTNAWGRFWELEIDGCSV